jgi:hypothetical protein
MTDMRRTIREAVINGAAFVLIRLAGLVYVTAMVVLATWSVLHSLALPAPANT